MRIKVCISLCLAVCVLGAFAAEKASQIRLPYGAGIWYPEDPAQLRATVEQYLNEATVEARQFKMAACVAPNMAYSWSGKVAAAAFKHLKPGQYDKVIILTPSNYTRFRGASLPIVEVFQTPLGNVPVDLEAVQRLSWSPLIDSRSVIYDSAAYRSGMRQGIHERENGVETILPFLQVQLGDFKIVPMVVGEFTRDAAGHLDTRALEIVAKALRSEIDDRTLVVASANFTRYGAQYGFKPFPSADQVGQIDEMAFQLIVNRNAQGFYDFCMEAAPTISGRNVIPLFLEILPERATGTVLEYSTSYQVTNDNNSSVSFAAFGFYDPAQSKDVPLEQTAAGAAGN